MSTIPIYDIQLKYHLHILQTEIIEDLKTPKNPKKHFRPDLSEAKGKTPNKLFQYIEVGWSEKPSDRPTAGGMARALQAVNPNK